jgi:non-ribosomal peptide synthetase component E (peptide arylation enzyme)
MLALRARESVKYASAVARCLQPERVTFVEKLERTSVGKINKRLLRELYP